MGPARRRGPLACAAVAVLAGALVTGLVGLRAPSAVAAGTFTDDDGNVHEADIETLVAAQVTGGCDSSGTLYCPSAPVSRGQMATFLVRSLQAVGVPVPPDPPDAFPDDDGTTHELNIDKLAALHVAQGSADGTYRPAGSVTRGQMALFLQRAFALPDGPATGFTDVPELYRQAVQAIAAAGITKGCDPSGERYCPQQATARDQMASFLARAMAFSSQSLDPAWEWGPPEPDDGTEDDGSGVSASATPDGTDEVGGPPPAPQSTATSNTRDVADPDPCALLTLDEWRAVAGAASADPVPLEGGTVCGYRNAGDTRRLALAALPVGDAGGQRWLSADDAARAEVVPGLGDTAYYLRGFPLAQSATLVVQAGGLDLVLEMSSRRDPADDALRDDAVRLARLALGRTS